MADRTLDLRQLKEETATQPDPTPEQVFIGPELVINVSYTDPTNKVHNDALLSRVLTTVDGRAQVGRIQAKLAGAQPFDTMPQDWRTWASAVAICTVQIDKPPDWFLKWAPVDDRLLFAIAVKLWEHNDLFFRAGAFEGSQDAEQRIVVDAPDLSRAHAAAAKSLEP